MLRVAFMQLPDGLSHVHGLSVDGRIVLRIRVCADDRRCHLAVCVDLGVDDDVGKRRRVGVLVTVGGRILLNSRRLLQNDGRLLQALAGVAHYSVVSSSLDRIYLSPRLFWAGASSPPGIVVGVFISPFFRKTGAGPTTHPPPKKRNVGTVCLSRLGRRLGQFHAQTL